MKTAGRILVTLFLVAVFGILSFQSWNGWIADRGSGNRLIAMFSDIQRWLMEYAGTHATAAIFAFAALFILYVGFFADRDKELTD